MHETERQATAWREKASAEVDRSGFLRYRCCRAPSKTGHAPTVVVPGKAPVSDALPGPSHFSSLRWIVSRTGRDALRVVPRRPSTLRGSRCAAGRCRRRPGPLGGVPAPALALAARPGRHYVAPVKRPGGADRDPAPVTPSERALTRMGTETEWMWKICGWRCIGHLPLPVRRQQATSSPRSWGSRRRCSGRASRTGPCSPPRPGRRGRDSDCAPVLDGAAGFSAMGDRTLWLASPRLTRTVMCSRSH